jgi:iron complex outermembrane receptor protein
VAWRLSEEAFLKDNSLLSDLKLRLSYGETGQQDGIGNYGYLPIYTYGQDGAQYLFGNQYYYTYRPEAYNSDLKWESTTAYNAGLDFGFLNGRISGSLDYYTRKTKDLLAEVPTPAGANFNKTIMSNVGNVNSNGLEFTLNATPVSTRDITWNVAFNVTYQQVEIDNLSLVKGATTVNTPAGPTIDNTYLQILSEGYAPYMFYVYKQLYDEKTGKPVEGAYANLDANGEINSGDLYHYHSPAPDWMFGFSTQLQYKQWNLGMGFRANVGNYVYNGMAMNTGAWGTVSYNDFQLNNLHKSYLETGFQSRQYLSDYYVENASFLKMDNLTLGYDFGEIVHAVRLNISARIQNVFTWTNYSGVDPEVPSGFDSSFYPRPRIYSLSLGFQF